MILDLAFHPEGGQTCFSKLNSQMLRANSHFFLRIFHHVNDESVALSCLRTDPGYLGKREAMKCFEFSSEVWMVRPLHQGALSPLHCCYPTACKVLKNIDCMSPLIWFCSLPNNAFQGCVWSVFFVHF